MPTHHPLADARYPSISDFLDALNLGPRNPINREYWEEHAHAAPSINGGNRDQSHWLGADCANGDAVQAKMRDGWQEGRDRMQALRDSLTAIEAAPVDRRRRMVWSDSGDTLDIHRVYSGQIDAAWRKPRRVTTQGPQRVDVVANMLCSGGDHSDVLFYRGAAAATLADMLETAGYMVRLIVVFGGKTGNGEKVSCRITIKDHGAPFDVTSTSATIMPGFFRALGHAWIGGHCVKKMSDGGITVEQGIVEAHEILASHNVRDHGTALAFINDTIAKVNDGGIAQAA